MDLVKLASVQSCATSASQPAAVVAATAVDQVAFVAAVVVVFVVAPLKLVVAAYEKNINFSLLLLLLLLLVLCAAQIIVRLTNHCTPQMHLSISYCTSASVYCVLSVILVMTVCVSTWVHLDCFSNSSSSCCRCWLSLAKRISVITNRRP